MNEQQITNAQRANGMGQTCFLIGAAQALLDLADDGEDTAGGPTEQVVTWLTELLGSLDEALTTDLYMLKASTVEQQRRWAEEDPNGRFLDERVMTAQAWLDTERDVRQAEHDAGYPDRVESSEETTAPEDITVMLLDAPGADGFEELWVVGPVGDGFSCSLDEVGAWLFTEDGDLKTGTALVEAYEALVWL